MSLTYGQYLRIDELLSLQSPLSDGPEHDELLFIQIHQVYELWFKQVLHETAYLQHTMERGESARVLATLKRVLTVFKTLVGQVDVLETMTPLSFLSFRERLDTASGFQSAQFRVLEFALGYRGSARIEQAPPEIQPKLRAVCERPSLYTSFLRYLAKLGHELPESALTPDLSEPNRPSPDVQTALLQVYRAEGPGAQCAELMVDLDEGLQEWRYRHVKMVERTIGSKTGTGGSSGVEYLRRTLFSPLFPDLWAIRGQF